MLLRFLKLTTINWVCFTSLLLPPEEVPTTWLTSLLASSQSPIQEADEGLVASYNRGNSLLVQGNFEAAIVEFNKAAVLGSSVEDVFLSRGIAFEKLLRWDEAIKDYETANSIHKNRLGFFSTDDPIAISNKANAETGLEKWKDALLDFERASQLKGDYLAPQIGRALVLCQLDRSDEAFAFFKLLVSKYPRFADGNAVLAVLSYRNGDMAAAQEFWEVALEEDSRYQDVSWVRDIRRWPPILVQGLNLFKAHVGDNF